MVKVKICGLTSLEDAEMVCNAGADFLGVIVDVDVSTPREISPDRARKILKTVPGDVRKVMVTMTESLEEIKKLEEKIDPDYLQIHSELTPSQLQKFKKVCEKKIICVASIPKNPENPEKIISMSKRIGNTADLLLLDTKGPGGGTGKVHNWEISFRIRNSLETPLILAGGLSPSNVKKAIEKVNPYAVDVASGVESEPGKKDPELVKEFFDKVGG